VILGDGSYTLDSLIRFSGFTVTFDAVKEILRNYLVVPEKSMPK
jgi:hypothetical protein